MNKPVQFVKAVGKFAWFCVLVLIRKVKPSDIS